MRWSPYKAECWQGVSLCVARHHGHSLTAARAREPLLCHLVSIVLLLVPRHCGRSDQKKNENENKWPDRQHSITCVTPPAWSRKRGSAPTSPIYDLHWSYYLIYRVLRVFLIIGVICMFCQDSEQLQIQLAMPCHAISFRNIIFRLNYFPIWFIILKQHKFI